MLLLLIFMKEKTKSIVRKIMFALIFSIIIIFVTNYYYEGREAERYLDGYEDALNHDLINCIDYHCYDYDMSCKNGIDREEDSWIEYKILKEACLAILDNNQTYSDMRYSKVSTNKKYLS